MAEAVPFGVAANLWTMLSSSSFDQIGMIYGVKKDLKKLKSTLSTIKAALLDAEERQEKSHLVKDWVRKLKDVVYDADDVLDAFATKLNLETGSTVKDKVREFFSYSNQIAFRIKMSNKIKEIRERMDEIAADMSQFNFRERIVEIGAQNRDRGQTHSFMPDSEVIGREKDKEEMIELLICSNSQKNLSLVAIVGIGGLGKTTLARLVYNDDRVLKFFELTMWVGVSEDFDVKTLVEKLIRSATDGEVGNLDMDQLQRRLRETIRQKRFLLVLDDVWNENNGRWDALKNLLVDGAKGSSILVTTRSRTVASIVMGAENAYVLQGLTEDTSWTLFEQLAFRGRQESELPSLITIGKEILKKCKGVPLAIRTLGSVMSKSGERGWLSIQNNEIWMLPQEDNDIMPVLRLSYEHLPIHLRQCFAYCSIFPKDFRIYKQQLIQLWMAQGYIQSSSGNELEEDIGDRYFEDLLSRSFFHEVEEDKFGNIESCKMHDLIHDLSQMVARTDCLIDEISVEKKISEKVHHISLEALRPGILRPLLKAKGLRTILQVGYKVMDESSDSCPMVLSNFKSLRVLDLSNLNILTLPNSIGKLKHLRYLDLTWNTKLKSLPNCMCNLHNLQTLNLTNCTSLIELPIDTRKLINLVYLMIDKCDKLTHMPVGLGKLISLQQLPRFVVPNTNRSSVKATGTLNELKELNHLRGELVLEDLENVRDAALESKEVNLKEKKYLQSLRLEWSSQKNDAQDSELLLDYLQPHPNLKELHVYGYEGIRFSDWLSSITNLVRISIRNCERCTHLPPLDQLPFLKFLTLSGMALAHVGCKNFFSSSTVFFPSLVELNLYSMPNLKGWVHFCEAMTNLHQLEIIDCPKLTCMPPLPNLKELNLYNSSVEIIVDPEELPGDFLCQDLEELPEVSFHSPETSLLHSPETSPLSSQEYFSPHGYLEISPPPRRIRLQLHYSSASSEFQSVPDPTYLDISNTYYDFPNLNGGMRRLAALQKLKIRDCLNLTSLSEGINLQKLEIWNCPNLTLLPDGMHLHELEIKDCRNLTSLPEGLHLQKLEIWDCPNLSLLPDEMYLQELVIRNCPKLTSLPKELHLQKLKIWDCPNLALLSNGMHLQELEIHNCPNLTLFPEGMHIDTLQRLEIKNCHNLEALPEWKHFCALQC